MRKFGEIDATPRAVGGRSGGTGLPSEALHYQFFQNPRCQRLGHVCQRLLDNLFKSLDESSRAYQNRRGGDQAQYIIATSKGLDAILNWSHSMIERETAEAVAIDSDLPDLYKNAVLTYVHEFHSRQHNKRDSGNISVVIVPLSAFIDVMYKFVADEIKNMIAHGQTYFSLWGTQKTHLVERAVMHALYECSKRGTRDDSIAETFHMTPELNDIDYDDTDDDEEEEQTEEQEEEQAEEQEEEQAAAAAAHEQQYRERQQKYAFQAREPERITATADQMERVKNFMKRLTPQSIKRSTTASSIAPPVPLFTIPPKPPKRTPTPTPTPTSGAAATATTPTTAVATTVATTAAATTAPTKPASATVRATPKSAPKSTPKSQRDERTASQRRATPVSQQPKEIPLQQEPVQPQLLQSQPQPQSQS